MIFLKFYFRCMDSGAGAYLDVEVTVKVEHIKLQFSRYVNDKKEAKPRYGVALYTTLYTLILH